MNTNIVCSETYVDSFYKLDKKAQKKSLETMRSMQRSMKSDSLKIEKLNTKLNFKSVRVTQDFRAIFTQSGNTVLLVYIDHHDDAYDWAERRLQGFDVEEAKPVSNYFINSQYAFDPRTGEAVTQKKSTDSTDVLFNINPDYNNHRNTILIVLGFLIGILLGAAITYCLLMY